MSTISNVSRLRKFIGDIAETIETSTEEQHILLHGKKLLSDLVSVDDWLPEEYAIVNTKYYQQYLLHADSRERFSVVSFVWGPGQYTPIHNHTVWGLIGVLRGAEISQSYKYDNNGKLIPDGHPDVIPAGKVEAVSPSIGDLHQVKNAYDDKVSVSIHVYGANIGAVNRSVFYPDGSSKDFISGYSNAFIPNIWDKSK